MSKKIQGARSSIIKRRKKKIEHIRAKFTYLLQVLKLASTATVQELAWVRV